MNRNLGQSSSTVVLWYTTIREEVEAPVNGRVKSSMKMGWKPDDVEISISTLAPTVPKIEATRNKVETWVHLCTRTPVDATKNSLSFPTLPPPATTVGQAKIFGPAHPVRFDAPIHQREPGRLSTADS